MIQMPYIIVKEFGILDSQGDLVSGITKAVKDELALVTLNYQFGYIEELNQTLTQYTKSDTFEAKKFPLIWVEQPFTIRRSENAGMFGTIELLWIYICTHTKADYTAKERLEINFEPVLIPIYLSLLNQMDLSLVFSTKSALQIAHTVTDSYYLGEKQERLFGDKIDCIAIAFQNLSVTHKPVCTPFKSW